MRFRETLNRQRVALAAMALVVLMSGGCAHNVADDYDAYLAGRAGESALPGTHAASQYLLPPASREFSYTFSAVSTGLAHQWIVDIGRMLDDTLQSADVQAAFNGLEKASVPEGARSGLLIFELEKYDFDGFAANVAMTVTFQNAGRTVFSRHYSAVGKSQMGKMILAGVFGQKNAVQQSTKDALDEILVRLIDDLDTQGNGRAR